jgi:mono/diheme cytochrome c family protein
MKSYLFLLLITSISIVACSTDVDEVINPGDTCDTDDVSFQDDVLVMFNNSCNGCHNASSNFGGITLDNHTDVVTVVDAGRLIGAVRHDAGFSAMPQGGAKLSDCNIDKISAWVSDGALNN